MKPYLIDSHAHLQFAAFDNDRGTVIERMKQKNIWAINIGSNFLFSQKAVELAEKVGFLYAVIGLHPIHLFESQDSNEGKTEIEFFDKDKFLTLIKSKKVVGVGECGLDYFHNHSLEAKERQKEEFKKQIEFANEIKKPLVLHLRAYKNLDAYFDALEILKQYGYNEAARNSGVVHFFSGDLKIAEEFIKLGFYISFPGVITFTDAYDKIINSLPLEKLLVETDCPYVAPVPYRGKRNEPIFVEFVADRLAKIKKISLNKVAEITTENCFNLFQL
ncbi:MAG: TatD family hydrolase [Patescibacteria group bacterium]|jgi:TatD DNase family protein|nr:TatD family hydrolase [Patescibacteria group bacterium]